MNHLSFSPLERALAFLAGVVNLLVGLGFFFLPELHLPLWPTSIPAILDRFIGAIIIGNSAGAFWLATEHAPSFWIYFLFDVPFLLVYYALFVYHDIMPRLSKQRAQRDIMVLDDQKH